MEEFEQDTFEILEGIISCKGPTVGLRCAL